MNPSTHPLELIHIEVRHEEMIREAAQRRLVKEALEDEPSKANALQTLRAFFSQSARHEPAKAASRPMTTSAKAKPRTA